MSDFLIAPSAPRPSQARRPRGVVRINGAPVSFLSFEVIQKNYFSAATWTVELEVWEQTEGYGLAWWDAAGATTVEILVGFLGFNDPVNAAPQDPSTLVLGQADNVVVDPIRGRLTVTGRDLTALFIDTKTANKWPDQTSAQIALQLAEEHGFSADVTSTSVPVGTYYDSSYAALTSSVPEWDLLTFLAQREGFDCYMQGSTLYFGPPQNDTSPYAVSIEHDGNGRTWSSATSLTLNRALTFAQDLTVTVLSQNVWGGTGTIKAVATRAGVSAGKPSSAKVWQTAQNYVIRKPGLTQQQANQFAQAKLADITRHERVIDVTAEGDPSMGVHRQLVLSGTGTSFDDIYFLDRVTHRFDSRRGYQMTMHAKNHPVASELAAP